jgi:hypothetical protein
MSRARKKVRAAKHAARVRRVVRVYRRYRDVLSECHPYVARKTRANALTAPHTGA